MSKAVIRPCFLEISSWIGLDAGATHYYGKLVFWPNGIGGGSDTINLYRKLSPRSAARLNKAANRSFQYRSGSTVNQFDDRQEIINLALATYNDHFPEANTLILGHSAIASPQPVLAGPDWFKNRVNAWADKCQSLGWYEGTPEEREAVRDIVDEFWAMFSRLTIAPDEEEGE